MTWLAHDARLRVGVSGQLAQNDPATGHGRVWSSTLAELSSLVRLIPAPPGDASATPGADIDVYLVDGHAGRSHFSGPVVAMVHEVGWTPAQLAGRDDSGQSQPLATQTAAGVASATRVIVPSEASRQQVIDRCGVSPARVHAVPEGVDPTVFHPAAEGGRSLVARHAEAVERPYLLFVGTLHPRKNLAAVREAVGRLARRGYPHALAILACEQPSLPSDPRESAAADLPDAPGRVVMLPRVTDPELAALMAGADAFCLPSLGEGFGLPALEAMACGTVVVVSDRGALPEVVGDAGLIVQPTPKALERTLRRVLDRSEEAAALRARAVERAQAFDWARTARGWARVLALAAREASH